MTKSIMKCFFMLLLFSVSLVTFIYGFPAYRSMKGISKDKDKVTGDFNGDGKKEAISHKMKYENMECICTISFSSKKIEPLIHTGSFVSYIRNEGELDKYPGEEFTVYWSSCEAGEWMGAVVYSIRDGKWKELAVFSVYGDPGIFDSVKKDPSDPTAFIVTENFWKEDSLASAERKVYPE